MSMNEVDAAIPPAALLPPSAALVLPSAALVAAPAELHKSPEHMHVSIPAVVVHPSSTPVAPHDLVTKIL